MPESRRYAPTTPPRSVDEWVPSEFDKVSDAIGALADAIEVIPTTVMADGDTLKVSHEIVIIAEGDATIELPAMPVTGRSIKVVKHLQQGEVDVVIPAPSHAAGWEFESGGDTVTIRQVGEYRFLAVEQGKLWYEITE